MRIVVGMSGGVDSSVAALLLKREGHEVIGVFMNNWEEKDESGVCTAEKDWSDVRRVCDLIDIPYYSVNFAREYKERVFARFLAEYELSRTPNPDVLCNREIKFSAFLDFALKLGAEKLATGHFANLGAEDGRVSLLRAADEAKDQTYFLYMLGQRALSRALFPVGNLVKGQVREIARKAALPVSDKKDSTGVCFIGERDFRAFLRNYLPATPGEIVTEDGKVVGRHQGVIYYTLGQRRGLGIGGSGTGQRWFVIDKDARNNRLVVAQGADSPRLYSAAAAAGELTWIAGCAPGSSFDALVRLRHRQPLQEVRVEIEGGRARLFFRTPQRAVTPGQSAVLYRDRVCLGGGIIE
jgi:tRNA-specific 2-thiouridylase